MKIKKFKDLENYILKEMKKNPCWKGYEMIGTKQKKGKEVPNCVPKQESEKVNECNCEEKHEEIEGNEYSYKLNGISDLSEELASLIKDRDNLPSWVQNKIVEMEVNMDDIYDYFMEQEGESEFIDAETDDDDYESWADGQLDEAHKLLEKSNLKFEWSELDSINESFLIEAEYQGKKVKLGKIMQGDVKKFKVYVKNDKGSVVKVNFGQKGVKIKKNNPKRRKSFRARHKCSTPGPRWKPRYWACKTW